jgi:hypothetical protein
MMNPYIDLGGIMEFQSLALLCLSVGIVALPVGLALYLLKRPLAYHR